MNELYAFPDSPLKKGGVRIKQIFVVVQFFNSCCSIVLPTYIGV